MTRAVLEDFERAPVDARLKAALSFLRKMTLAPDELCAEDAAAARAAGVTDEALRDAIYVAALFNVIDRVADALGFEVPPARGFAMAAPYMLRRGYRL